MKKMFLIMALCVAFCMVGTAAFAQTHMYWCGTARVDAICLDESNPTTDVPTGACCVAINFSPLGGGGPWDLLATAQGTQLNLALLEAYGPDGATAEIVNALLRATQLVGPFGITWSFDVERIGFGLPTLCDPCCTNCP